MNVYLYLRFLEENEEVEKLSDYLSLFSLEV